MLKKAKGVLFVLFVVFAVLDIVGIAIGQSLVSSGLHIDNSPIIVQYWIVGSVLGMPIILLVLFAMAVYYIFFDR
jgi:hypothetical protein